jgi:hypothetical protein
LPLKSFAGDGHDRVRAAEPGLVEVARDRPPEKRDVGLSSGQGLHGLFRELEGDRAEAGTDRQEKLRRRSVLDCHATALDVVERRERERPRPDHRVADAQKRPCTDHVSAHELRIVGQPEVGITAVGQERVADGTAAVIGKEPCVL